MQKRSPLKRCKDCRAPVIWARNVSTNTPAPLDAVPDLARGRLMLDKMNMRYRVIDLPEVAKAIRRDQDLYTNHLSTCSKRERIAA